MKNLVYLPLQFKFIMMNKITFIIVLLLIFTNAYSQDGTLDNTFGTNGKVSYTKAANAILFKCGALQNNGQLLAGGILSGKDGLIVRYNSDGKIDQHFGTAGEFVLKTEPIIRIDVSGAYIYVLTKTYLFKLDSLGVLDDSFAGSGFIKANSGTIFGEMAISPSAVYVSGSENTTHTIILKYNHNGQAVSSFGNAGTINFKLENNSSWEKSSGVYFSNDTLYGSTTWADKAISIRDDIGYVYALDSNGSFINSFGTGGKLLILDTTNNYSGINKLSFNESNHFYVGGNSFSSYSFLARINKSTGQLDPNFGNQGVQKLNVEGSQFSSSTVQADERPLLVSVFRNASNKMDFHLVRSDLAGNLDNTFGTTGEVKTSFFDNDFPNYMIYDKKNNKIIVFGHADGSSVQGIIVRYNVSTQTPISGGVMQEALIDFNVYPNPSSGDFYIMGHKITDLSELKIYDVTGQSFEFESKLVNNKIQINLDAKAGIYVLRGQLDGKEFSQRIILTGE